jgi:hypothetical protein
VLLLDARLTQVRARRAAGFRPPVPGKSRFRPAAAARRLTHAVCCAVFFSTELLNSKGPMGQIWCAPACGRRIGGRARR